MGMRPAIRQYLSFTEKLSTQRIYRIGRAETHTQAGQGVDSVNVHGAASADTLSAAPAEGQGGVDLVLNTDQSVQHHGTSLVQVQGVGLHSGLLGGLVRVPAVDMEGLDPGSLRLRRILHGGGLGLGNWLGAGGDGLGDARDRVNGGIRPGEDRRAEQWPGGGQEARGRAKGSHGGRTEQIDHAREKQAQAVSRERRRNQMQKKRSWKRGEGQRAWRQLGEAAVKIPARRSDDKDMRRYEVKPEDRVRLLTSGPSVGCCMTKRPAGQSHAANYKQGRVQTAKKCRAPYRHLGPMEGYNNLE